MEVKGSSFKVLKNTAFWIEIVGDHLGILKNINFSVNSPYYQVEQFLNSLQIEIEGTTTTDLIEDLSLENLTSSLEDSEYWVVDLLASTLDEALENYNINQAKCPQEPRQNIYE